MEASNSPTLPYEHAQFRTQLPLACRYTATHAWLVMRADGRWRVGITKFGSRMAGETVDHGFHVEPGAAIEAGQRIGWVEGFKAVTDLLSAGAGTFVGGNPALKAQPDLINEDPHGAGWLYEFDGEPEARCLDAAAYQAVLDRAIDCLIAHRHRCDSAP